jgi:hypothetical protein
MSATAAQVLEQILSEPTARPVDLPPYRRAADGTPVHGARRNRRIVSETTRSEYGVQVDSRAVEEKYCATCESWQHCDGASFSRCPGCGGGWRR